MNETKSSRSRATLEEPSVVGENCDNLNLITRNTKAASASNTEVTSDSSSAHRATAQVEGELATSTEAAANSLLNLIVRLARASVNLNMLSSDKQSELKKNGEILINYFGFRFVNSQLVKMISSAL